MQKAQRSFQKNVKERKLKAGFYSIERKRMQKVQRSFQKNVKERKERSILFKRM